MFWTQFFATPIVRSSHLGTNSGFLSKILYVTDQGWPNCNGGWMDLIYISLMYRVLGICVYCCNLFIYWRQSLKITQFQTILSSIADYPMEYRCLRHCNMPETFLSIAVGFVTTAHFLAVEVSKCMCIYILSGCILSVLGQGFAEVFFNQHRESSLFKQTIE